MRLTNNQLLQIAQDAVIDDATATYTGLSDTATFLKREINNTVAFLFSLLRQYKLIPPGYTENTVISQQSYKFRAGFSKLESMTVDIGDIVPPLRVVQSQSEWDALISVPLSSGFPTHVFPQRDTFSLYPTPTAVYPLLITGSFIPTSMTVDDYTTGTASITTGDETVTITGVVTAAMVGRWFGVTDSNGVPSTNLYRIASRTDATHFELDRKVVETTASGQFYVIGQSPEIPEELHDLIPYRAASIYYKLRRKDASHAQELLNFFYTGDYDNNNRRGNIRGGVLAVLKDLKEKGRDNSQLVEMGGEPQMDYMTSVIWGTTLS